MQNTKKKIYGQKINSKKHFRLFPNIFSEKKNFSHVGRLK